MALNIKHTQADMLARKLAEVTGQSITDAVIQALREQLQRETGRRSLQRLESQLRTISSRCSQLPDHDLRSADEIIGFDEHGLPR
jgi:antitoxin VapB